MIRKAILSLIFLLTLTPAIYAQVPGDIDKNPTIVMDKQVIELDRRALKAAQEANNPAAIRSAKKKLQLDIRKMKADKAEMKKSNQRKK